MTMLAAAAPPRAIDTNASIDPVDAGDLAPPKPAGAALVRALLLAHGYNSSDFLALYRGWQYFVSEEPRGVVAYQERGWALVASGDPICAEADLPALLNAFAAFARRRRRTCAFLGASERLAAIAHLLGFAALKVGEEPFFDLASYAPRGDRAKKVRSAVNQAVRAGLQIRLYRIADGEDLTFEREAAALCRQWQATRPLGEMGFGLTLEPFTGRELKRYAAAYLHGRMVGFLACSPMPARNGYYLEDVIRAADAPNGATELLITTALAALRAEGVALATLGVAPLAGVETQPYGSHRAMRRLLVFTRQRLNHFYHFKTLNHYKRKYAPSFWEDSYLLYQPGHVTPRLLWSLLAVFTPVSPLHSLREGIVRSVRRKRSTDSRWQRARHTAALAASLALVVGLGVLASRTSLGSRGLPLIHLHLWLLLTLALALGGAARGRTSSPLRRFAGR